MEDLDQEARTKEVLEKMVADKKEEMVKVPNHCQFLAGDVITAHGYHYRFKGYSNPDFFVVFEPIGPTAKSLKRTKGSKK